MKQIVKKIFLLFIPIFLYLIFFIIFEPNNYFGLKDKSASSAPIARIKEYELAPQTHVIVGDSRLAHFDMEMAVQTSGEPWQNLAFGGASLRETIDLSHFILDSGNDVEELLIGLSFYTLNKGYDKDRMSTLEDTLKNPLAYIFNLEYTINALVTFKDTLLGYEDVPETGDWTAEDYIGANGEILPLHRKLYDYPATIYPVCEGWEIDTEQVERLKELLVRCQTEGVRATIVLPPMADNVLNEVCKPLGIAEEMQKFMPEVMTWQDEYGCTVLDYEWQNRPEFEDDKQFFDGFHLDTKYGLPEWQNQLFSEVVKAD